MFKSWAKLDTTGALVPWPHVTSPWSKENSLQTGPKLPAKKNKTSSAPRANYSNSQGRTYLRSCSDPSPRRSKIGPNARAVLVAHGEVPGRGQRVPHSGGPSLSLVRQIPAASAGKTIQDTRKGRQGLGSKWFASPWTESAQQIL